jgi:hypothetical protein
MLKPLCILVLLIPLVSTSYISVEVPHKTGCCGGGCSTYTVWNYYSVRKELEKGNSQPHY